MTAAAEVLQRLEGFPQDLSDLVLPDLSNTRDADELIVTLDSLAQANASAEARNSIVQVTTRLPPHKFLEGVELAWIKDPGSLIAPVITELAASLNSGTYDVKAWTRAAASANTDRATAVVGSWAADHFEAFLDVCKDEFQDPSMRLGILNIVQYIMLRAPYTPETPTASTAMGQLASHDFFPIMLKSLLLDTSNHIFALGLSALVIILPFSLLQLNRYIPLLMVVLGRAMCWRDRPFFDTAGKEHPVAVTKTPAPAPSLEWNVATTMDEEIAVPTPTEKRVVQLLLVALYGAWPSNIIAFIRDPPTYLGIKQVAPIYAVPWDEVWEPGQLQARCVPLISDFMLHNSIITHTSSQELADEKRWDRYDPSEFVAMAHLMSGGEDSDAIFEFFKTPKVDLDPRAHGAREAEPTVAGSSSDTDDIRRLKEENELLRLESLYADRLRRQLVHHIGRLHRNSLRFNSDEAEIHNFVNRLKEQSKTIATLTHDLTMQRAEATQAQQKHVKWQEQLRDKVSGFREERRNWMTEATQLRTELSEAQAAVLRLRDELAKVKNERFTLSAQQLEMMPKIRHIEDYETRMKQLTDAQLLWDADVERQREAEAAAIASQARCAELEGMLRAREKICREQADTIQQLESRAVIARSVPQTPEPSTKPPPHADIPDPSFYVNVAENARRRCEKLERDNLELTVELERLRRLTIKDATRDGERSAAHGLLFG